MSRKLAFLDLTEFRHLYWEGWPEARMARHFKIRRPVVRRIILESGLLPRNYFDANRFLAEERTPSQRRAYTAAANKARRSHRTSLQISDGVGVPGAGSAASQSHLAR